VRRKTAALRDLSAGVMKSVVGTRPKQPHETHGADACCDVPIPAIRA